MIKLIACDMDGTLVRDDNTISDENINAIRDVLSAGIDFMPCTGRGKIDLYSALPKGFTLPAITLNGAQLLDEAGKEQDAFPIDRKHALEAVSIIASYGFSIACFTSYHMYLLGDIRSFQECLSVYALDDSFQDYYSERPIEISTLNQINDEHILKLETMSIDAYQLQRCFFALQEMKGISVTTSMPFNIEITSQGIHKAKMLEKLCEKRHLTKDEILVLGDSKNDRELFEVFPNSIAVANADWEIKQLARYVTKSCEQDGVAFALHELMKKMQK